MTDPDYNEAIDSTNLRFAFKEIGALIREGVYDTFPEKCPECGGKAIVSHGGDRVHCHKNRGVDQCGWHETRCGDCGVTPSAMFTYTVSGNTLCPPCVQRRGLSL